MCIILQNPDARNGQYKVLNVDKESDGIPVSKFIERYFQHYEVDRVFHELSHEDLISYKEVVHVSSESLTIDKVSIS